MEKRKLGDNLEVSAIGLGCMGLSFGLGDPYGNAAQVIESSDLDYTVIRPAWLNNKDEIAYGTTHKNEPFANPAAVVSRKSVADLVVKLALTPGVGVRDSLGVHKQ